MGNHFVFEPLSVIRRRVLLDTDIGPDCDDVGALAVLFYYARKYGVDIGAIGNCTSNSYGNGAIDAVAHFCGYNCVNTTATMIAMPVTQTIPIGAWSGSGFLDDDDSMHYNKYLTENFSPLYSGQKPYAQDAAKLYRRVLSATDDGGAIFITIGPLNNIAALLMSEPDDISPLSGVELVRRKVYAFVSMAGLFPSGREYNVVCDGDAAEIFTKMCPVPCFFSGSEFGVSIVSGFKDYIPADADTNPVYQAYDRYVKARFHTDDAANASYDLTAVHFAFCGEGDYYKLSEAGVVSVDKNADYANSYKEDKCGKHYVMHHNIGEGRRFASNSEADEALGALFSSIMQSFGARRRRIYLSPSKQPANQYAVGDTNEQVQMEDVARRLRDILAERYDVDVKLSDLEMTEHLSRRSVEASEWGADFYLAIHSNAVGEGSEPTAAGAVAFHYPNDEIGINFCRTAVRVLNEDCDIPSNRASGVYDGMQPFNGYGYAEVRNPHNAGVSGVILEVNFHDNPQVASWIIDNKQQIAESIARALAESFELHTK